MKLRHLLLLAALTVALLFPFTARADLSESLNGALHRGSFFAFVLVFVGGVLTSLTPCVYPLIPITLSIFGARGERVSRARALTLATAYVGGIAAMYTSLGVGSALLKHAFGTFMASPFVMVPIAVLFLAMASSMFGAFEMNLPPALADRLSRFGGAGYSGAFAMGLVAGIIAAPCTGPVLASLLTYIATTGSVLFGGSLMFTYALGMGMLFFVLAGSAASLPRSGAWMEMVKSVFGVVMVVAALYFLRNVIPPLAHYGDYHPRFAMIQGAILVAGLVAGGIHLDFHGSTLQSVRKGVGVTAVVFGGFGLLAFTLAPKPYEHWVQGEPAATAKAKTEGKAVLLDFGADWCIPCKEMELKVFGRDDVQAELDKMIAGKVDCTDDSDAVDAVKARYGADTLPTVVLLGKDGAPAHKWNRVVEPEELLQELIKLE